jgi:hypothetical protein
MTESATNSARPIVTSRIVLSVRGSSTELREGAETKHVQTLAPHDELANLIDGAIEDRPRRRAASRTSSIRYAVDRQAILSAPMICLPQSSTGAG